MPQPPALKRYWANKNKSKSLGGICVSCHKRKNRLSNFGTCSTCMANNR